MSKGSLFTCHVSHVTCHFFFFAQSGEAYWWRICYQQGLPCLVSFCLLNFLDKFQSKDFQNAFPLCQGCLTAVKEPSGFVKTLFDPPTAHLLADVPVLAMWRGHPSHWVSKLLCHKFYKKKKKSKGMTFRHLLHLGVKLVIILSIKYLVEFLVSVVTHNAHLPFGVVQM